MLERVWQHAIVRLTDVARMTVAKVERHSRRIVAWVLGSCGHGPAPVAGPTESLTHRHVILH